MEIQASLERIYPDETAATDQVEQESVALHLERYGFAAEQARGPRLLDIASGCGYGTALMARQQPDISCTGVDVDPLAVDYAQKTYFGANLQFLVGNGMTWKAEEKFNTIVSLETIEHLPDPNNFVQSLTTMLAPGGIIVASVPTTPTKDGNPFHLHDFTRNSFLKMFRQVGMVPAGPEFLQVQRYFYPSRLFKPSPPRPRTDQVGNNIRRYYLKHPTALLTRLGALCRYGFNNHYLTLVFRRESES